MFVKHVLSYIINFKEYTPFVNVEIFV